ncbi:6-bladed beta-propeller [Gemmatimonadota bacterium]
MKRIPCTSLILICLSACSSPDEIRTHSFRVFEENGVTIAESTGGPKYEGDLFTYEKVLTLQQDTTQIESSLYGPEYFVMDENGYFYVADVQNYRIAVFDSEGKYSHQFGREGRGPGEFRYPRILLISGDIIAVENMNERRTSVFNVDGTLERDLTAPLDLGYPTVYPGPDRSIISMFLRDEIIPEAPQYRWYNVKVVSANGNTLGEFSTPRTETGFCFSLGETGGTGRQARLFGGRPQTIYSPGRGILTTTGQTPEFHFYGIDGKQRLIIRADVEKTPVTDEERSAILESFRRRLQSARARGGRGQIMVERQFEIMKIPDFKDYWADIYCDEYGYIWAGEPIMNWMRPEEGRWFYVFSPEGEYLGTTLWKNYTWARPSGGYFMAIIRDPETYETFPTVFRMRPAVRGLKYP